MKGKSLSILLIFSLAINLAVVGSFIFFKLNKPDFYRTDFDRFRMKDMNFNKEQRDQVFKKFREMHRATKEGRQEIKKLEKEMYELLLSDSASKENVDLLIEKIGQLRLEQSKLTINRLLESQDEFTKEQRMHFIRMLMKDRQDLRESPRGPREGFKNKPRFNNPRSDIQ